MIKSRGGLIDRISRCIVDNSLQLLAIVPLMVVIMM